MGHVAQRVAGGGVLHARQRHDVAREGFIDVFAVVGVHQQHAADLFLLVLHAVQDLALGQFARIDAGEGQRTDKGIVHDLKRERAERRVVA